MKINPSEQNGSITAAPSTLIETLDLLEMTSSARKRGLVTSSTLVPSCARLRLDPSVDSSEQTHIPLSAKLARGLIQLITGRRRGVSELVSGIQDEDDVNGDGHD